MVWIHGALLCLAVVAGEAADTYPSRPVRFIIPYPAGGATDILARSLAQKLTEVTGQPVFVENRAGAGGAIGTDAIAKAAPDGYTIGLAHAGPLAINPSLLKKLPYNSPRDFTPISLMGLQENVVVVHPSLPVRSIKQLIALAKARPGEIIMGSGGTGTGSHLAGAMFLSMTGVKMLHVPYKGNAPAVIALLSGETQIMFPTILTAKPHVEAGRLRALAVTTAQRVAAMPNLPTVAQAGVPHYESSIWFGVMGPAGMPADMVTRLNTEVGKILNAPSFKASFVNQGLDIKTSSPEEFIKLITTEKVKWAKVVKDAGIHAQ
ncbi:MAG: hypothetical protein A3F74_23045 [Betaproteobacteria bacterium RIFCSPLOWO2_12_FULL_62_58]|nr:MAG: hypothetical protein A3F74_23045 [Betaproteobacteria bacterium RIFCSPLOWO2_12_FULL_62_58]